LKNSKPTRLPLSKTGTYKIVVGGKSVDNLRLPARRLVDQAGRGGSGGDGPRGTTFLAGPCRQATRGTNITPAGNVGTRTKGRVLRRRRPAIWVGGETPYAEGKGDSSHPRVRHRQLPASSATSARTFTTCIAILYSGPGPLIVGDQLPKADAFVGGVAARHGRARASPMCCSARVFTGKLPVSWPASVNDEPINSGDGKTPALPPRIRTENPY